MLLNIVENPHEETQSVKCIFDWVGKAGHLQDICKSEPARELDEQVYPEDDEDKIPDLEDEDTSDEVDLEK